MGEMADRVEHFADRLVSKTRVLTACLASAAKWAEIDPCHPDGVAVRNEIVKLEPEVSCVLNDLVALTQECEVCLRARVSSDGAPLHLRDEQRIAAAVADMTTALKEYSKQRESYVSLPGWVEDPTEYLIGSHRFFRETAWPGELLKHRRKTRAVLRTR